MQLERVKQLIRPPLTEVDAFIKQHLFSEVELISDISDYIIQSGGKRIRPTLHLLASLSLGYQGSSHIACAAIIEFIHTATLLHDDVVDDSAQRRGRATANQLFGNAASVLVGDFLYSRAFQIMVTLQKMPIMSILANATNVIAEGEVLQLSCKHQTDMTIEKYFQIIQYKTAQLFEAATELAAVLNDASPLIQRDLALYGRYTGIAFQIMDDILDYSANSKQFGKNIGDDLAEGKITLPLLYALQNTNPESKSFIQNLIQTKQAHSQSDLDSIRCILKECGSLEACHQTALEYSHKAQEVIQSLPNNHYTQALLQIAEAAVNRVY